MSPSTSSYPSILSHSLLIHRLNSHLRPLSIPTLKSFSDLTPSLFIILFESLLKTEIPYVRRHNVQIKDYMHNLTCWRDYLCEMGLEWIRRPLRDQLDLWDLIDIHDDDENALKAVSLVLDTFEDLKDWIKKKREKLNSSTSKNYTHQFQHDLEEDHLNASARRKLFEPKQYDESASPPRLQEKKYISQCDQEDNESVNSVDLHRFTSNFERMTSQKKWKEAASLIRELESKANQVRDSTRKILELDHLHDTSSFLGNASRSARNKVVHFSPSFTQSMKPTEEYSTKKPSSSRSKLYDSKLSSSLHKLQKGEDDDLSVHSFDDLKPSPVNTILNESSIRRASASRLSPSLRSSFVDRNPKDMQSLSKEIASRIKTDRVNSRFQELQLEKSFGDSEVEIEKKMDSLLKSHRELKRERELLENERILYHTLNAPTRRSAKKKKKTTRAKKRPKSARLSRRRNSSLVSKPLSVMKSRRRSLRSSSMKPGKKSFSEFRKLYNKYLDAFLNGESDVKPELAVRNYLRDKKIEEIRMSRQREDAEQRLHKVEALHQREQERAIRVLMKKMHQVEKEKRRFEKQIKKELDSELSEKRRERQLTLESYYKKQIGLLQQLIEFTEGDDRLTKRARSWARELFDRSHDLSRSTLGILSRSALA